MDFFNFTVKPGKPWTPEIFLKWYYVARTKLIRCDKLNWKHVLIFTVIGCNTINIVKMKWSACHVRGTKKKSKLVPDRIRTFDLPNTGWALYPLELWRTHGEWGLILGSYLTLALPTARISNVNVTLSGEKKWKMVNFKLSEINVKMKWSACHEHGTKKKSNHILLGT